MERVLPPGMSAAAFDKGLVALRGVVGAEWVLDTFYGPLFHRQARVDKAFLLSGANAYESALLDLMERIVADYPMLRLFSLPSMSGDGQRRALELGVEGEPERVDQAMAAIRQEVERRGITWQWRAPDDVASQR